ncbi:MAG TPA: GNAT family N-acetyltransferase [Rubrivivax sp.]|nr:GNAT family N-acetyltransferase [Rubrivivax sp.]
MNHILESRGYPRQLVLGARSVCIAPLGAADAPALAAFVQTLSARDLSFVRRDISHPKVQAAWLQAVAEGRVLSLAAHEGEPLAGCTAIVIDPLSWSRHVGELRVLVAPDWRGCGLGRALIQECFALALGLGLEKLMVQMTLDQSAAIAVFEELGFRAEAVLRKQLRDRDGVVHDLALFSHDIAAVQSRLMRTG